MTGQKMQGILLRAPHWAGQGIARILASRTPHLPPCVHAAHRSRTPFAPIARNLRRRQFFSRRVLLERPTMASRWTGLARPSDNLALVRTFSTRRRRALRRDNPGSRAAHAVLHAAGAFGVFLCATVCSLIVFPEVLTLPAYAQTITSFEQEMGFFSMEPAIPAPPAVIVDEGDVHLLAATTWAEARSQGEDGMRAVAHVVVNRIGARFGEDLETVVLRPKQFSA